MKTTTLLTPLIFLIGSAFAAPAPVPATADTTCVVAQVIYPSIETPFTLVARNSSAVDKETLSTINKQTLSFVPLGSGLWDIGIHGSGQVRNTTLTNGTLSFADGSGTAYIVEPSDRPLFRTIKFAANPETPAKYEAYMKCIDNVGYTVIRPVRDDSEQVFCLHKPEGKGEEYGLKVHTKGAVDGCIQIDAVVTEGIRPL